MPFKYIPDVRSTEKKSYAVKIVQIFENKKQFLDLLLLADELENMIDRYLPEGDLSALDIDDLRSVAIVFPTPVDSQ